MNTTLERPFRSIESAHDFVMLLTEAVVEAKQELKDDVERESVSTRLEVLRMALYSLEKLELHVTRSGHILDDLQLQRRLLFEGQNPKRK